LPARIASIDALRGFSMIWILGADAMAVSLRQMFANAGPLLANLGEMVAHQLEHAPWEGLRFYDLLFPLFIFVSGASIVFSLTRVVQEQGLAAAHWRVLRRSALLYTLGVIYYGGLSNPWPDVRLLGVLQRIALCYFFASILFLHLRVTGLLVMSAVLLDGCGRPTSILRGCSVRYQPS
jgi:predicted acyltransferase